MAKSKLYQDPRGGHVRIYWDLLDSHAWHALAWSDQGLFMALRRKLLKTNNGNIEATLAGLKRAGVTSSASLSKSLRALLAVGLIDKTRQGGVASGGKLCSLYRFTDEPVLDHPKHGVKAMRATNDWKRFGNDAAARAALRDAHQAALRPETQNKRKVQMLKAIGSDGEPDDVILDSASEQVTSALLQRLNMPSAYESGPKPA